MSALSDAANRKNKLVYYGKPHVSEVSTYYSNYVVCHKVELHLLPSPLTPSPSYTSVLSTSSDPSLHLPCVQFYVKVGLYLGATALCALEETPPVSGDQVPRWNKTIDFETLVQDLPLSGRLCMGVVGVSKRKKREVS